jgi:hypothetical protein
VPEDLKITKTYWDDANRAVWFGKYTVNGLQKIPPLSWELVWMREVMPFDTKNGMYSTHNCTGASNLMARGART